ncbi:hypothetical protein ACSSS7_004900 [Eimeria intestinalis]
MEALAAVNTAVGPGLGRVDQPTMKPLAAYSLGSAEEGGLSTVCCSSDDEAGTGLYLSDDERQDSDAQPAQQKEASLPSQASQQPFSHHTVEQATVAAHPHPFTYTVASLDSLASVQPPVAWLKPRIKIDGPEVFHGLLRANDDTLPATDTIPSTETFVSFQDKWRVVTAAGSSSYLGPTMNPWDPATAAYPLPITYQISEDKPVVRNEPPPTSRAYSRMSIFERLRRSFCTSVAEYMQS